MLKTFVIALILVILSITGLSIGLILTGKPKLKKGCGKSPEKKECEKSKCGICEKKK